MSAQYYRLLIVDRGIGLYERRDYTASAEGYGYGYGLPRQRTQTYYAVVQGPTFLPDKVDVQKIVHLHGTKADALASLERLALARFTGESEEQSQPPPPPQPQGKEISGHRASSMQRGSGILYPPKKREGYDPRDFNGVVVTTDTGRAYWCAAWNLRVNGKPVLEVQLQPKV
jgi:hypothetical protein